MKQFYLGAPDPHPADPPSPTSMRGYKLFVKDGNGRPVARLVMSTENAVALAEQLEMGARMEAAQDVMDKFLAKWPEEGEPDD